MPDDAVRADYSRRIQKVITNIDAAECANRNSMRGLIGALALAAWLLYAGVLSKGSAKLVPAWSFLLPLPLVAAAGLWHGKNRDKWLRLIRLRKLHERGVARMDGEWRGGFTGEEFRVPHHVYDVDLQVLGEGSLFEMMCTARTGIGRRQLAEYLLHKRDMNEAKSRQEAVRELAPRSDLREQVELLGRFSFQESTWGVFSDWIAVPAATAPGWVRVAIFVTSLTLGLIVVGGFITAFPLAILVPRIVPLVAILIGAAWFYRARTNRLNAAASRVGVELGVVREGIELLAGAKFQSKKLLAIQRRVSDGHAAPILRRLERLTNALAQCEKPQFDLFAQALAVRTQLCFAIEQWKLQHADQLGAWLDSWGEFEALTAISGYTWEHPDDVFPEFAEGDASFTARDLGHPLIPVASCVRNHIELSARNRFYVVSGSNMAGKSTLLRSIGLNVVLANAGAPVRASSLRLTNLEVLASLSIVDSILEGKSKFLAEVERIRKMLECARHAPVLFLIDEILSGTNSRDRRIASEGVIRALVNEGAIGALSTHDLALTEIAGLDGLAGTNVHMSARPGNDPMDFDYLLKPGVTTETNALAITAMMGVTPAA